MEKPRAEHYKKRSAFQLMAHNSLFSRNSFLIFIIV